MVVAGQVGFEFIIAPHTNTDSTSVFKVTFTSCIDSCGPAEGVALMFLSVFNTKSPQFAASTSSTSADHRSCSVQWGFYNAGGQFAAELPFWSVLRSATS